MGGGAELLSGMERDMIRLAWEEGSCNNRPTSGRPCCSNPAIRMKLPEQSKKVLLLSTFNLNHQGQFRSRRDSRSIELTGIIYAHYL